MSVRFVALSIFVFAPLKASATPCTYDTWSWNTRTNTSVDKRHVAKDRSQLDSSEKGTVEGCSVCSEDQEMIRIDGLPAFEVCRKFAPGVRRAVEKAQAEGVSIESIVGYRVGKTKGAIDS